MLTQSLYYILYVLQSCCSRYCYNVIILLFYSCILLKLSFFNICVTVYICMYIYIYIYIYGSLVSSGGLAVKHLALGASGHRCEPCKRSKLFQSLISRLTSSFGKKWKTNMTNITIFFMLFIHICT